MRHVQAELCGMPEPSGAFPWHMVNDIVCLSTTPRTYRRAAVTAWAAALGMPVRFRVAERRAIFTQLQPG